MAPLVPLHSKFDDYGILALARAAGRSRNWWGLNATVICALACTSPRVLAQPQAIDAAALTIPSERAAPIHRPEEQKATDWGVRPEEWTRYRLLMQGSLGVYSPNLDPLTALGIEARSDEERRRYAELQVRAEARRVEKTLAYQRAYDAAWQRLAPGMQPVKLPGANPSQSVPGTAQGSGRVAVFVKDACAACEQTVQRLQATDTEFDVYVVGTRADDARIRDWARRSRVDAAKVRGGRITLNHDGGRWLSLGLQGDLPAVVQQVGGQWQRQP